MKAECGEEKEGEKVEVRRKHGKRTTAEAKERTTVRRSITSWPR